jgi:hypothetical protein
LNRRHRETRFPVRPKRLAAGLFGAGPSGKSSEPARAERAPIDEFKQITKYL